MNKPHVLSASTIQGDRVRNREGEDLGKLEEVMLDVDTGRVAYAVLSVGGFLGVGDKLFAIPWGSLQLDPVNKEFVLDIAKERLDQAPGFDKNDWPDMADRSWGQQVYSFYGKTPHWTAGELR